MPYKKEKVIFACPNCKKDRSITPSQRWNIVNKKKCSGWCVQCKNSPTKNPNKKIHNLFASGITPWNKGKRNIYSKETLLKMRLNARHWKGGINKINNTIRNRFSYRKWRQDIF